MDRRRHPVEASRGREADREPAPEPAELDHGTTTVDRSDRGIGGPIITADGALDDPRRVDRATFLERLRGMANTTAAEMLGERWSASGCPYIDAWFEHHVHTDAASLERIARRYGGIHDATTADELIEAVRMRMRMGIAYWQNGEDLTGELALGGLSATADALAADRGIAGAMEGDELQARRVAAELGEGERLGGLAGTITSALGGSVPDVRVHTGATAARLADAAHAEAFTIGRDVVYGATAPRPGSLAGDVLLAHELAHAQQQTQREPRGGRGAAPAAAEADANAAAIQVGASRAGRSGIFGSLRSVISTGLSLQRCPKSEKEKRIEGYEGRLKELEGTQARKGSFSEVAGAAAEERAIEHWLSVEKGGKGERTGSRSTEADLPKCNCTTYVVDILEHTFSALGKQADWKKVKKQALALNAADETGINGIPLQRALVSELGWKAVFFAPDPTYKDYKKIKRDASHAPVLDSAGQPIYIPDTEHGWVYDRAKKNGKYYKIPIDQFVVNYAPEKGTTKDAPTASTTAKDTSQLDKLAKVPFGVLTARGGKHMALIMYGKVYEVHWDQPSSSLALYDVTSLEDWGWDSGAIVAPADEIDKAFK